MCATGPTSKLTEMNELLKDPTYNRMGSNIALFPVAGINVVRFDCRCCGLQPTYYQCIGWIIAFDYNVLSCAVLVLLALPAEGDAEGVPCGCRGHEVSVL